MKELLSLELLIIIIIIRYNFFYCRITEFWEQGLARFTALWNKNLKTNLPISISLLLNFLLYEKCSNDYKIVNIFN